MCSAFKVFYLINYYCKFMFHVHCFSYIKVKSSFFKKLFSVHILYTWINTVMYFTRSDWTCHHRMDIAMTVLVLELNLCGTGLWISSFSLQPVPYISLPLSILPIIMIWTYCWIVVPIRVRASKWWFFEIVVRTVISHIDKSCKTGLCTCSEVDRAGL
jgi:hypothetical protein